MRRMALISVHSESAGGCDPGEKIESNGIGGRSGRPANAS
jgi:hypothetical protein